MTEEEIIKILFNKALEKGNLFDSLQYTNYIGTKTKQYLDTYYNKK